MELPMPSPLNDPRPVCESDKQVVGPGGDELIFLQSTSRENLEEVIDAIWWSTLMNDGSVYVKIRWSPVAVEANNFPGNEQVIIFIGSKSVKIEPSRPSPFCFTRREVEST